MMKLASRPGFLKMGLLFLSLAASSGGWIAWSSWSKPAPRPTRPRFIDPDNPCGPVAVATASHLLGRPIGLGVIRSQMNPDPMGRCSLTQVYRTLRGQGFSAFAVRLNQEALMTLGAKTVAILFVDRSHFVVVRSVDDGVITLFDPPYKPVTIPVGEMPYDWSGEAILASADQDELIKIARRFGLEPPPTL